MPDAAADQKNNRSADYTPSSVPSTDTDVTRSSASVAVAETVLKWLTLAVLTLQSSAYAVCIRYSMVRVNASNFLQTSVVLFGEILKLLLSVAACFCTEQRPAVALAKHLSDWADLLKLGIISFLYTVQNNFVFFSMMHLSPAVAQIVQQTKLLFTAGFAVCLLKQRLSMMRWFSLLLLAIGVSIVQVQQHCVASNVGNIGNLSTNVVAIHHRHHQAEVWMGFSAAIIACALSGFTGVYLEKVLKSTSPSVWIRNIQLSITAIPMGLFFSLSEKHGKRMNSLFEGYDWLILVIMLLFAFGGILVALAIKYADNILKGFATSLSIILTSGMSVIMFGFILDSWFVLGALFVIFSLAIYLRC
ncbi:UDP galactose translocator [Trichuris trichiura]|uniref:UDP galactose translocator n=1 Tax=Trichuris trichiura TaxID=36087 RepID=A0A077YY27_TRITR|nr:UDP galactose translocator [Trichuris trichiura]